MALRVFTSILLVLSIFFMPFWLSVVLALAGMMYFRYYIEAVFVFLIGDLLYGAAEPKLYGVTFALSIMNLLLFICIEYIKPKLKYYS